MRRYSHSGFTLLELMIVVAIAAILAVLAAPDISSLMPRYRLNRTVREFADNVQLARILAISQNREYRICLDPTAIDPNPSSLDIKSNSGRYTIEAGDKGSGSTTWDILPIAQDGFDSDVEGTIVLDYSDDNRYYAGISITGWTSLNGPYEMGSEDCIVFSPRGWLSNPVIDFSSGYIEVYFRNKAANPRNESRTVQITRGGIASIREGD